MELVVSARAVRQLPEPFFKAAERRMVVQMEGIRVDRPHGTEKGLLGWCVPKPGLLERGEDRLPRADQ